MSVSQSNDFEPLPESYRQQRAVGAQLDYVNGSVPQQDLRTQLMKARHERPHKLNDAIRTVVE